VSYDDYEDLISREFARRVAHETQQCRTNRGTPVRPDGTAATAWWSFGRVCGAMPDGRLSGDPFNDGSVSPPAGKDVKGPTAVLKSVAKVDPLITWNQLFNQSVPPDYLSGKCCSTPRSIPKNIRPTGAGGGLCNGGLRNALG